MIRAPRLVPLVFLFVLMSTVRTARGWDEPGHVIITRLAIARWPVDLPAWVVTPDRTARLCYLSAEPDRWRGQNSAVLDHINSPDHYLDAEDLADFGLQLSSLPRFRNTFIEHLATVRALDPQRFRPAGAGKDASHTKTMPGFLPYAIEELRWKLASSWSTLRTFEAFPDVATPTELDTARDDVVLYMGLMSHFVGDGTQPLHLTRHHNGWVGANPNGYTRDHHFHAFVDGDVLKLHSIGAESLLAGARPPTRFNPADDWSQILACLDSTYRKVEPLYRLEKSRALRGPEGKKFIEDCLLEGGSDLSGLWIAAYRVSVVDSYLSGKLRARREADEATRRNRPPAAAPAWP